MLISLAFTLFSALLILSAVMVIASRNPVHSVLFLIAAFFNAAALFILLGAEFLALILMIVYVGAVAVLFLFVVMMLDIDFVELKKGALQYLPLGVFIGGGLAVELGVVAFLVLGPRARSAVPNATMGPLTNTESLGRILYTDYVYYFQIAGLILLVAMIGAIVLTLRQRAGVKRQAVRVQIARDPAQSVTLVDIPPEQGA